jgi:fission process protein 1
MALPAFTIHTTVRYASKAFKNVKNPRLKGWGPTTCGLAVSVVPPVCADLRLGASRSERYIVSNDVTHRFYSPPTPHQVVPFLPYIFDHPVERAVDVAFEKIEEAMKPKQGTVIDSVAGAATTERREL